MVTAVATVTAVAFHDVPPVIQSRCTRRLNVDLFDLVLADVCDVQEVSRTIERKSPGIAHACRPDLGPCVSRSAERIPLGNRVWLDSADVEPEDFAKERILVLPIAVGIPAGSSIAHTYIKHSVRAEHYEAAVVICVRLIDCNHELR